MGDNNTRNPTKGGKVPAVETPQNRDEKDISGHMPEPDADDNVLDNAREVGLYDEGNEEE